MGNHFIPSGISWEKPFFYFKNDVFIPKIFTPKILGEKIPPGFNSVKIALNGRTTSDLDWKIMHEAAVSYIEKGFFILWDLQLGVFLELHHPLSDQMQYLSLGLAVDHFRDFIWNEFREYTIGVSLYKGSIDFSLGFYWDEEQKVNFQEWLQEGFSNPQDFYQETGLLFHSFSDIDPKDLQNHDKGRGLLSLFCRNASVEYLELLANRLPDPIQLFISLDASAVTNPLLAAQLLSKERFDRFHMSVKNSIFSDFEFLWGSEGELIQQNTSSVLLGVCLPSIEMIKPSQYVGLEEALTFILENGMKFRVIPEESLIMEWDGLDNLIVSPSGLSSQGIRKLQGFCAAGGVVVNVGKKIGLRHELSFHEWILTLKKNAH